MTHLDEGRLLAYLDGELTAAEAGDVETWLGEDEGARLAMETLRQRTGIVADLLAHLDAEPAMESAARWNRVRNAVLPAAAARERRPMGAGPLSFRRWIGRTPWAQAAALALLFGGTAAAAIPGSPLRSLLADLMGPDEIPAAVDVATESARPAEDTGIRVSPADGQVRIRIRNVDPGTTISVTLVERDAAALYAPVGASFVYGDGSLDATIGGEGSLRVEIPRGVPQASLEVNGRMYLMKEGDRLDLAGPYTDSTATEIRFQAGE